MRLAILAVSIPVLLLAADTPEPGALLTRAVEAIRRDAGNMPRFTCSLTVNRSLFLPARPVAQPEDLLEAGSGRRLAWTDKLRLEIAVSHGRELFSWPGESAFHSASLEEMVPSGATASGEFGPFEIGVFLSDADPLSFRYMGTSSTAGKQAAEYSYRVPVATSHYFIRTDEGSAPAGYEGHFWIDPDSAELRRLSVAVSHAPEGSHLRRAVLSIDYERRQIGGANGLLPSGSTLRILLESGALAINRSAYGGCRQYLAESTVRFEGDPPVPAARQAGRGETAPAAVRAGLKIETVLTTPIDSETTFTGDAIEARVARNVKEAGGRIETRGPRKPRIQEAGAAQSEGRGDPVAARRAPRERDYEVLL